jgi:hypothetical protein
MSSTISKQPNSGRHTVCMSSTIRLLTESAFFCVALCIWPCNDF